MSRLFPIDKLLSQVGTDDKYELSRLAIQRLRNIVKEKNKRALDNPNEKPTTIVLHEIMEGKVKVLDFRGELRRIRSPDSKNKFL